MAEVKKAAPAAVVAEPAPKKKNTVLYIVIALLLLVVVAIVGVGAFLFLTLNQQGTDPGTGEEATVKTKAKAKKKDSHGEDSKPVFAKLDTFTVNLRGSSSVLQTEIYVQMADEHMKDTVTAYLPRISSQIILLLSSKSPEDLSTMEAKQKLMGDVKDTINKVLGVRDDEDGVKSAEFKTFIVQ